MKKFDVILPFGIVIAFIILIAILFQSEHRTTYSYEDTMMYDAPAGDTIDYMLLHDLESLAEYTPKKIKYIVVHCTAAPPSVHHTPETLMIEWRRRWGDGTRPGYHYFVDRDGLLHNLWAIDNDEYIQYNEMAWGARGHNSESVHISYDGGVDAKLKSKDTRNINQKRTLAYFVNTARLIWPNAEVIGHWRIANPPKDCPSFDAKAEYSR